MKMSSRETRRVAIPPPVRAALEIATSLALLAMTASQPQAYCLVRRASDVSRYTNRPRGRPSRPIGRLVLRAGLAGGGARRETHTDRRLGGPISRMVSTPRHAYRFVF